MVSISGIEMEWLTSPKNPSVSAAERSWVVISEMRFGKSWSEILGIVRLVYFVGAIMRGLVGGVFGVGDGGVRER